MLYLSHGLQHPKNHNHFQLIFSELRSQAGDPPWNSTWNKHKYGGKMSYPGRFPFRKNCRFDGEFSGTHGRSSEVFHVFHFIEFKTASKDVMATSKQCKQWVCKRGSMAAKLFHLTRNVFGISNRKFCLVNGKRPLYIGTVYKERGRKILTGKNSGLVNFVQESRLPFVQIRNGLKLVSKMALKKWNTYFRLQHSSRKNKTTF